jgi:hypothetical protein
MLTVYNNMKFHVKFDTNSQCRLLTQVNRGRYYRERYSVVQGDYECHFNV